MPKILWLVSVTLPEAAVAVGLPAGQVGGGWLSGMLAALPAELPLTVVSVDARTKTARSGKTDGVRYLVVPDVSGFGAILARLQPDLVHIWGTEYTAALAMQQEAARQNLPVLVGIQGVMCDCAEHLCDDVPPQYRHSNWIQRGIDRVVPGGLLDKMQANFDALAQSEARLLAGARHVTGRTGFDRRAVARLAPDARYYPCNETLRPVFWQSAGSWRAREYGQGPVLLLSQGNYPLKNLHTLLKAMPAVLREWPGAVLRIAGWPPLDKGKLLRPVIDAMFPYQTWCKKLIARGKLEGHVQYTGPLQAAQMRQAYLDADLFLLTSYSENSPNSLGEAMLLGMPCVAAAVGGVPDVTAGGAAAVLYGPAGDADALAEAICRTLALSDHGTALGRKAADLARQAHDPAANAARMLEIYRQVLAAEQGAADA